MPDPLEDAIAATEQSKNVYTTAAGKTTSDQNIAQQIQNKLTAANQVVADDVTAQNTAAVDYNAKLDNLSQAALAAKIPLPATGSGTQGQQPPAPAQTE